MGKHTPGPWTWADQFCGLNGADSEPVLRWEPYEGMWVSTLNDREEANARLIAAAPEMYEALHSALFAIEGLVQQQAMPDKFYEPAAAKVRAAIAKAEGA